MGTLKKDLKKKLICVEGDPKAFFQENPETVLDAIVLSAQMDLDIEMDAFKAMQEAASGLEKVNIRNLCDKFEDILVAEKAARGLRIAVAAGVLPYILGSTYPPKSKYEIDQFNVLLEKLDVSRREPEYRFPMLFMCFDQKRGEAIIDHLCFDEEVTQMFKVALQKVQDLYFIVKPYDFKKFLYENGRKNYDYWEALAKQQRKLYDYPENRIMSRYYMLQDFEKYKMAIYIEDLAVNEDDLLAAGIPAHKTGFLLEKLLYRIHYFPRKNNKEYLISEAKRYNRNPFAKYLRDVHFVK